MSARDIARSLLEIKAVFCNVEQPFTLTSGSLSPVYVDMRWVISFPESRRLIADMTAEVIRENRPEVEVIAGGETAGIPYAAWAAERLDLPMIYVRKQPKGFGRNALLEGQLKRGQRVVLVEDLIFDGQSKVRFVEGIRAAGGVCDDVLAVFNYAASGQGNPILSQAGIELHALTNWPVLLEVARDEAFFSPGEVRTIEEFLADPQGWSRCRQDDESNG